jgi:PAS domain S-box-containing protein
MESEPETRDDPAADIARLRQELERTRDQLQRAAEQPQALAALEARERRFRDIADAAGEFLWEVDASGRFTYVNQICHTLLGYAEQEVVGKMHFYDFHPEQGREEFRRSAMEVFARRGTFVGFYNQIVGKDGKLHELLTNGVPIIAENGELLGYRGSDRDITELRRTEAALAAEANRRRVLFEQSRDGIVVLDTTGKVFESNRRFADMLGYPVEELCQLHVWDWDVRWTREQLLDMIGALGSAGDHFETRHRRKDGSCYDTEISTSATVLGDEKLVLCICRDITRRLRSETLLRARLRLSEIAKQGTLQALVQFALDSAELLTGSCIGFFHFIDPDQETVTLQTWSTNTLLKMCQAEGADRHYPVAKAGVWADCMQTRAAVIHNDYASLPHKSVLPEGHAPLIRELTFPLLRDGRVVAILGVGNKVVDYAQDDVEVVQQLASMLMDLVARKQAEDDRHQMELQLLHTQKLESLGILAGGIAHDFNNILAGIRGYADLVLTELAPATTIFQRVEEIRTATRRAADLTRQILTYAGKGPFRPEALDVSHVVGDMRRMLEVAVSKKATLDYDLAAELPATQADASQIRQVLMNLVANASEALGENAGRISITTRAVKSDADIKVDSVFGLRLPAGQYVALEVTDNGSGMEEASLRRIFDPFFTTKFAGRGLGLATVQGIVRSHHGAVLVSSRPGRGSTFCVLLPATEGVRAPGPVTPAASAEHPARQGSGTVLVVDDEESVRKSTEAMLVCRGFDVLTAGDGEEALDMFRRNRERIVCVLLDLTMPKMSGAEVLAELRRMAPEVRVILTSGYPEEETMRRVAGQRVLGFVQKPSPIDEMIVRLQKSLAEDRDPPADAGLAAK